MAQLGRVSFPQKVLAQTPNSVEVRQPLDESVIQAIAKEISIQIETENEQPLGSGVIVRQQALTEVLNIDRKPRYLYSVLTAHHVIQKPQTNQKIINITTYDGHKRPISLDSATQINTNDLAVFYFISANDYSPARWGNSQDLAKVFSAGFACETNFCPEELTLTSGVVAPPELLAGYESFQGGFSIGHDSDIYNGMSGGAILDRDGSLVGINNRKKYPPLIFANSEYRYQDGSQPSKLIKEIIPYFAWGIPIETYIEFSQQPTITPSRKVEPEFNNPHFKQLQNTLYQLGISYSHILQFLPWLVILLICFYIVLLPDKPKKPIPKPRKKQLPPSKATKNNYLAIANKISYCQVFEISNIDKLPHSLEDDVTNQ